MIRCSLTKFFHQTCGASAIEFAIVVPILFLLLTGLSDLGIRFLEQSRLNQITREGAAAAMAGEPVSAVITRMQTHQDQLGGAITGGPYGAPELREICYCAHAIPQKIDNCRVNPDYTTLASCNGTGPWEIYLEISQVTPYRPILALGKREVTLQSMLRVQIR